MNKEKLEEHSVWRNRLFITFCTVCSTLFMSYAIFGILPIYTGISSTNGNYNVIYFACFTTIFTIALAWIVLFQRYVRFSLLANLKIWTVLSKLTYWVYFLHMPAVFIFNHSQYLQNATSGLQVLYLLPLLSLISYSLAFLFYMFVESPLGRVTNSFYKNTVI